MKMWKKVIALVAVFLLVLSTMSIGVCAEGETGTIGITITASKTTNLYPGDIVTFTINISTNYRAFAMRWPVMYTLKAFEPVVANDGNGDADYGNVIGIGTLADPASYLESGECPTNDPFGTPYAKSNYGCLLIQWTGGTTGTGVTNYYEPNGANCLTFQLRVKPGYTSNKGVGTVAIPTTNNAKNTFYLQGITDPADANTTYKMAPADVTVTSTPCTVNIIKEQAGIVSRTGTATVIDTDGPVNYIYGLNAIVDEGEEIDETTIFKYVTPTGDATFTLEDNDNGVMSTGAKLYLYDAGGTFLAEYIFVVFGDCNGDGVTNGLDALTMIDGFMYTYEWSYGAVKDNATCFSCDINANGMLDPDDLAPLLDMNAGIGYVNQIYDPDNFFIEY